MTGGDTGQAREPSPCQCHQSFAYIAPTHTGHCCFFPANSTCHQAEITEWGRALAALTERRSS